MYKVELYSLAGQLVQSLARSYGKKDSEMSVPVDALPAGTYLLRLTHEKSGKHISQQVIVQN
jgi:hypothetical protein